MGGFWIELTNPLGGKAVMTLETYTALPDAALSSTHVRLLTRAEFIAYLQRRRLARGIKL